MDSKRLLDLALGLPALAVAAPAIVGLGALVRLTSPGPALYRQRRVGKDRRPIEVWKLRTMVDGADRQGPAVTGAGDRRVTPLGALLRRTKLDELPQLWNVVRGDMSLVGPRPEAEGLAARYRPEWERIFSVRPGITDPCSLAFRDEESLLAGAADRERVYLEALMPVKARLAIEGVERSSPTYDLRLLVETVLTVLRVHQEESPAVAEAREAIRKLPT